MQVLHFLLDSVHPNMYPIAVIPAPGIPTFRARTQVEVQGRNVGSDSRIGVEYQVAMLAGAAGRERLGNHARSKRSKTVRAALGGARTVGTRRESPDSRSSTGIRSHT